VVKGQPNRVVEPPTAAQLKSVKDVIAGVVGLDANRGDQVVVEAMAFESTLTSDPPAGLVQPPPAAASQQPSAPALPIWKQKQFLIMAGGGVGGVLLVAGVLIFFLKRKKSKKKTTQVEIEGKAAIEGDHDGTKQIDAGGGGPDAEQRAAEAAARAEAEERAVLGQIKLPDITTKKAEVLTRHIRDEVKKSPESMAHVIRTWLNSTED
jgi:flagellar biosynthesis/type III secretory pathway M-ring protein FliF/YscJ